MLVCVASCPRDTRKLGVRLRTHCAQIPARSGNGSHMHASSSIIQLHACGIATQHGDAQEVTCGESRNKHMLRPWLCCCADACGPPNASLQPNAMDLPLHAQSQRRTGSTDKPAGCSECDICTVVAARVPTWSLSAPFLLPGGKLCRTAGKRSDTKS